MNQSINRSIIADKDKLTSFENFHIEHHAFILRIYLSLFKKPIQNSILCLSEINNILPRSADQCLEWRNKIFLNKIKFVQIKFCPTWHLATSQHLPEAHVACSINRQVVELQQSLLHSWRQSTTNRLTKCIPCIKIM